MTDQTFAEKLASRLLARQGIAAIWELHIAAASAYRRGYVERAEGFAELADLAEREWVREGLNNPS